MPDNVYRTIARLYDPLLGSTLNPAKRLGLEMYPPKPGIVILDVGCGTGAQLSLYRSSGCRLIGIDASAPMAEQAKRKLGGAARVDVADASHMPYADGCVDLALMSMMLHELPEEARSSILVETKRVLKRDGRILILDYHPGPLDFPRGWAGRPLIRMVERLAGREHFRNYRQFLATGGIAPRVSRQGLEVELCRIIKGGNFALFLLRLPDPEATGH